MEMDSDNDSRTSVCTWTEESFAPAADYIPPQESSASGLVTQIKISFFFQLYHFLRIFNKLFPAFFISNIYEICVNMRSLFKILCYLI